MTTAVFRKIGKQYQAREAARRALTARANEALSCSKRAVFALQRGDPKDAQALLQQATRAFASCESLAKKFSALAQEGSYRAALEEYAEACLFAEYLKTGSLGVIDRRAMDADVYLAGLCDATGEIVRYAVRCATSGDAQAVAHAAKTVEGVIVFLLSLDLTGYHRTKFDQAKKNLRQLEQMLYELRA